MNDAISKAVQDKTGALIALRRQLHSMPELAFQETETAALIAEKMNTLGLTTQTGIGKTGVVAVLEGARPGPTLMIRADIDGLPVDEDTGLEFASTNGVMHACGHDGHTSILITTAEILAGMKDHLAGKVMFLFQPAEEIIAGAKAMIDDGVLDHYQPDRTIGLHIMNILPVGKIATNRGPLMSGGIRFSITIEGPGGHAGLPNETVDPVVIGSQIVLALQTVVSREISPMRPGVLTIGSFISDSAVGNVISKKVELLGSVRAFDPEQLDEMFAAIQRLATGVGEAGRASITVTEQHRVRPTVNNADVAEWFAGIAEHIVGEGAAEVEPMTGGEDMSEFLHRVPGAFFLVGGETEGTEYHHSPKFDFDEKSLAVGVELFVRATADYLS
jgi:amidohydrolase